MHRNVLAPTLAAALLGTTLPLFAQDGLGVARYTDTGELLYPDDLDRWVVMGANLGSDYREDPFDPAAPGTIGVVQMEPAAYDYFLEHGEYADGTMFLLSFFGAERNSDPQLQGFVQGDMRIQEIHLIDKQRFTEGRAFFVYQRPGMTSVEKVADGSECVQCHMAEGDFDGTFTQFYPTIRHLLPE